MIRLLFLALLVMVTGCAGTLQPKSTGPEFPSVSSASLGYSLSLSQLVTGEHDGREYKMRYELDITPSRLAIVALSPLGVTLFTIVQEKGELSVERLAKGQVGFDPRYTLFDLYLTYWPRKILQPALARIRMRLDEATDGTVRRVRGLDGNLIAEIKYPPKHQKTGKIIIQHFDFPYRLQIETLDARGAP